MVGFEPLACAITKKLPLTDWLAGINSIVIEFVVDATTDAVILLTMSFVTNVFQVLTPLNA